MTSKESAPGTSNGTSKGPLAQDQHDEGSEEELNFSDEEGGYRIEDIYIPPPPRPALTTEDIGPRLIIIRITNRWFKSYAGPCIVGPFHKRFSAVIGPNGSGKSNVIDSMLFVFGYRASRIRSKKVSALIHKSEKYQDVESCSVAVHFAQITDKEGDAYDILPGSEFVVSRTANGDNSSYYELNGRRVQFREVALVLRKHGIDLDNNRFLILQGEVEQISLMKHKAENEHEIGMLEYLEDIIGTGRYKEPLAKLTERRQELSDKRNDKLNRCKLVKTELDKLKEPMEEAVAYLQLENNIAAAKNILIQIEIHATEADLASKNYQKEGLELELNQTVDNLKDLQSAQHKTKKNYSNASKEYAALEATKNKCKQVFEKLNGRDLELQAGMVETNKNRKKLKKQLETEQKKKAELSTIPEKAEEYIKELQTKEEELVNKKQKLEDDKQEVLVSIKDCTKELQERKEVLQADLAQLLSKVNEAKSAYTIAETELNIYTSNAESEQKKLDDLKAAHETARQMVIQRKGEIDGLKQEIPDAESKLQAATREFDKLTTRQYELTAQRREKTASMESSKSSMESMRSKGKVLDSLTQQKREGNCPGLFGRLGDLGAIDQKYDVAVSTACGALDHIVVDTVDTAEWCIEFLKKYDIGRATFIALDKQEHLRSAADSTIQTPEDVPRLYDLIRVQDDRVKTAFYFGLRDTLVASNLDQGSRIAYGRRRFRVVTLAGNLIETSGTMSGGGKRVSRGRMGQSIAAAEVQPEEIERLETQLRDMEREFVGNRERLTALNEAINELKQKLKEMKFNLNKFTLELDSLKIQEPALLGQMNEQRNKINDIKLDPEVVKDKTKTVAKFKEEHEKAQSNTARFQVEVDAITKEITDKTSGRVRAVDKRIKEVAKNLNAVQAQLTKEKISIANVPRNLAKCEEKIATLEEDILNSENKLTDMKTQRDEIEVDGAQVNKHLEGLAQQIEEKEEGLEKLKKEAAALDKQENEIKGSKIEIDGKLEVINKQVNQLQATVLGYRSELAKVKYHEVPDQPLEELKTYTAEELAEKNVEALKHEITTCRKALQRQQPNFAAIEEYKKRHGEYLDRVGQVEAVTEQWNKIGSVFNSLRNRRKTEFLTAFRIIRLKLREMYQMITLGGDADLELIDSYDPFTEGIKLNVRPPKKPWKDITNLSGGEKTLSSLALVFALHYYKPSPLYVMDEIDAALDFKNVSIIAHYIKERTKNAQFIIISLRPNMFELANYLVGIYKVQNCTSAITLDVGAFAKRGQASSGNANMEENNPPMEEERSQEQSQQDGAEDLEETLEEMSPSTVHSGTDTVIADSFPGSEDVEEMDVSK